MQGESGTKRYLAAAIDTCLAFVVAAMLGSRLVIAGRVVAGAVFLAVFVGYFVATEGPLGTTLGKWLFGLRVLNADGGRCSFSQALIRNVMRLVDANPVLLGALPGAVFIMTTRRRQRLGDLLARTLVVTRTAEDQTRATIAAEFD